jgi:hypothetical protein
LSSFYHIALNKNSAFRAIFSLFFAANAAALFDGAPPCRRLLAPLSFLRRGDAPRPENAASVRKKSAPRFDGERLALIREHFPAGGFRLSR